MDFDVLSMHNPQSIFSICKLTSILDAKVKYLTKFSDFLVDLNINRTKESYKIAIIEFFDDIKMKHKENDRISKYIDQAQQKCIQEIKAIKTPAQETMEADKIKRMNLYNNKDFYKKYFHEIYQPIFDRIKNIKNKVKSKSDINESVVNNTLKMIENRPAITQKYYQDIEKILEKQQKIAEEYNKIEFGGNQTIRTVLENRYNKYLSLKALHNTSLNIQDKAVDNTKSIEEITNDLSKLHEQDKKFINDNKSVISNIINSTIELKNELNSAEKYAVNLIDLFNDGTYEL
ncbi:hypothetical protein BDAP_001677 [Binucleata daphniae]